MINSPSRAFEENVALKFQIYNSLFLTLPFDAIHRTGTLLPILSNLCGRSYQGGESPTGIINKFFSEYLPREDESQRISILFNFVKYIERQVVLFDAIEEAAFSDVHDMEGQGTVEALFDRVEVEDLGPKLLGKFSEFQLRIVLTAHPTQFYPGHVLGIITDLSKAIRKDDLNAIHRLLLQLGKSPFINQEKPTPLDEAASLIWYLENVFFKVIPGISKKIRRKFSALGLETQKADFVRMGFWPGGDRDGNPFVSVETTRQTASKLRISVLRCYYAEARKLRRRLTFRHTLQPVAAIESKLFRGIHEAPGSYNHEDELLSDLFALLQVLDEYHDGLFSQQVEDFIARVEIFGFYFATLDIRQDSSKHKALFENILSKRMEANELEKFNSLSPESKIAVLEVKDWRIDIGEFDDPIDRDIIGSIQVIGQLQQTNGERACQRYIISNAQNALDIMSIYFFTKWITGKAPDHFDIVPLFETIDDLRNAGDVMSWLYNHHLYKQHLQIREMQQTIMLGFSDGTKDGGYLSANWSIFKAKEAMTSVSRENGVHVIFFDGRGGPPARGGGNTHKFYSSLGSGIENKEVQLTIQGQTVSSNFGSPAAATYNIEQLLTAGVENSVFRSDLNELNEWERALLDQLGEHSLESYVNFKNDPLFLPYLKDMGTLEYYGGTNIGSRPVKRGGKKTLQFEDLRAIPFVGSWSQMKQNVPGFYGFGEALDKMKSQGSLADLQKMYNGALFFKALVGNSMQSLAKSFFPLTAYLSEDPTYGDFWKGLFTEYKRSLELLLEISGQGELLEDSADIQKSIKMREEIVLPLLTIQQYALEKIRSEGESMEPNTVKSFKVLVTRTMFGIINAGRNSA